MEVDDDKSAGAASEGAEGIDESSASSSDTIQPEKKPSSNSRMTAKQLSVQQRIEQYFHRLTQGCNRESCTNPNCASNPSYKKLTGNEAAVKAITLLRQKAEICWLKSEEKSEATSSQSSDPISQPESCAMDTGDVRALSEPLSVYATHEVTRRPQTSALTSDTKPKENYAKQQKLDTKKEKKKDAEILEVKDVKYLTEEIVDDLIARCRQEEEKQNTESGVNEKTEQKDPYSELFCELTAVFSNVEGLNRSFLKEPNDEAICADTEKLKMDVDTPSEVPEASSSKDMEVESTDLPDSSAPDVEMSLSSALASYLSNVSNETELLQGPNTSGLHRTGAIKKKVPEVKPKVQKEQITVLSPTVDVDCVRRVYQKLSTIDRANEAFFRSLEHFALDIDAQLQIMQQLKKVTVNLNAFVTIMENPMLQSPEYFEDTSFPRFCKSLANLPIQARAELVKFWSTYKPEKLKTMVESLQQLITFKVLSVKFETDSDEEHHDLHKNDAITNAVKCLKLLFYASLYGGKIDKDNDVYEINPLPIDIANDLEEFSHKVWKDPLGELLGILPNDVTEPLLPPEEFQNEILNENFNIYNDFTNSSIEKVNENEFTFMNHPFVLSTVNKTTYFFYDNKIHMLNGRRLMILQSIIHRAPVSPYLRLKIRRDHVIADALVRLELIANENPQDLRKQLYVEFEDEEGVDEGGVSKEFFQLVVEQIFNPDYGMFTYNEKTNLFWFSAQSFENKAQFTLIGIVLGLAIYNSCILDIKFPSAVYKKLIGKKAKFEDMKESHPDLYRGLKQLLEYEGNVEEDMMATFSVEYSDMFGTSRKYELKSDGGNIPVTNENRKEYVDLHTNWLLNESIAEQFNAFRHGFELVVARSPLKYMFRTDELEVLISGSQEYDFNSLESTSEYDGGFSKDSQTVKDFWSVVHEMTDEDKRKLLQFTTGTDRAPVGGLSQLRLVIARNGPDSNRLPTAHTCFNVILLPDYCNREKLKERLHKAITYSKGFGML